MRVVKRVGAVIGMVLAVIGIAASLAGIVVVLIAREPVLSTTDLIFGPINRVLVEEDKVLATASSEITAARAKLSSVNDMIATWSENAAQNRAILQAISDTLTADTFPRLQKLQQASGGIRDAVVAFRSTIDVVNRIPGLAARIENLQGTEFGSRISAILQSAQDLQAAVRDSCADAPTGVADRLTARTASVDQQLANLQDLVVDEMAANAQNQQRILAIQSDLKFWINTSIFGSIILFLWLALAQVALFMYALRLFKFGHLGHGEPISESEAGPNVMV